MMPPATPSSLTCGGGRRGVGISLLVLLGVFVGMMCVTLFVASLMTPVFGAGSRASLFATSAAQCVIAFILTALISAWQTSGGQAIRFLGLDRLPRGGDLIAVMAVYITGMPAMNQLIYWNTQIHLPAALSGVEEALRRMEEANGGVAMTMLNDPSPGTLIAGILIVGLLTGLSEELFFRGALQGILAKTGHGNMAVWTSAFIFSAVHFQFFGFAPRLLLGAWFGYLMLRSASIYTSALAHALNNSIVVVSVWLQARGTGHSDVDAWGVAAEGFPWLAAASALLTAVVIFCWVKRSSKRAPLPLTGQLKTRNHGKES